MCFLLQPLYFALAKFEYLPVNGKSDDYLPGCVSRRRSRTLIGFCLLLQQTFVSGSANQTCDFATIAQLSKPTPVPFLRSATINASLMGVTGRVVIRLEIP